MFQCRVPYGDYGWRIIPSPKDIFTSVSAEPSGRWRETTVLELGLNEVTSIKHWLIRPLLGKHSYSTGEIKLNPYTSPAFVELII